MAKFSAWLRGRKRSQTGSNMTEKNLSPHKTTSAIELIRSFVMRRQTKRKWNDFSFILSPFNEGSSFKLQLFKLDEIDSPCCAMIGHWKGRGVGVGGVTRPFRWHLNQLNDSNKSSINSRCGSNVQVFFPFSKHGLSRVASRAIRLPTSTELHDLHAAHSFVSGLPPPTDKFCGWLPKRAAEQLAIESGHRARVHSRTEEGKSN